MRDYVIKSGTEGRRLKGKDFPNIMEQVGTMERGRKSKRGKWAKNKWGRKRKRGKRLKGKGVKGRKGGKDSRDRDSRGKGSKWLIKKGVAGKEKGTSG